MRIARAVRRTSIIDSPHEPTAAQHVEVKTIEAAIGTRCRRCVAAPRRRMEMNLQIPFVLLPGICAPPVAGCAPWAGSGQHLSAQPLKKNASGTTRMQLERCGNGRAKDSKARRGSEVFARPSRMSDVTVVVTCPHGFQRSQKTPHLKFSRAPGIHQSGRSDISFADHVGNARDSELQFFGIGEAGKKQAAL